MAITTVAPTITTNSSTQFKEICSRYAEFAKRVHLDCADGTLSDAQLLLPSGLWWPKNWEADIHLMTATPSLYVNDLIKLKPNLVILHAEAKEDLIPIFKQLKDADIKVGIAIVKNVYPGSIKHIIKECDHALIFSGNIGNYGGEADLLLTEKVALIRDINNSIEVGWDGGVNLENAHIITHASVDVLNVGSALANSPNPAETFAALNKATENEEAL